MGKVKDTVIEEDVGFETPKAEPILTHTALSMAMIPGEGWTLVRIKYNPLTGDVGKVEKAFSGELRMYIEEKYKIETVTLGIFNNSNQNY